MTEKKQPDLPTLYIFAMFLETAKTLLGLMSVFSTTTIFTLPAVRVRSTCIMIRVSVCLSVCLFVCPLAYLKNHSSKFQLSPWLDPTVTAVLYVVYFRFCG